jgi:hypothetical protein
MAKQQAAVAEPELIGEALEFRYVDVDLVIEMRWEDNPKKHDFGVLDQLIEENGFVDPPKFDAKLEGFVFGNGRSHVLAERRRRSRPRPRGVLEHPETGKWYMPVLFGVDAVSRAAAARFAIDHNNSTLLGGDFGPQDLARMWDDVGYKAVLADLAAQDALPVTVDGEDLDAILGGPLGGEPPSSGRAEPDASPQLGGMVYSVVVTCTDEDHQTELLERLRAEGLTCKPLIT